MITHAVQVLDLVAKIREIGAVGIAEFCRLARFGDDNLLRLDSKARALGGLPCSMKGRFELRIARASFQIRHLVWT
jgi:hypothetical protein